MAPKLVEIIMLTYHWGLAMHICVNKRVIIGSDNNGSQPIWRQAISWTNASSSILSMGIYFSEILMQENRYAGIILGMGSARC